MVALTRTAACLGLLAVAGCYDLERLDPGAETPYLPVDDFEDQDKNASVSGFGPWTVFPFRDTDGETFEIGIDEGFESAHALKGAFHLVDPGGDFTGASLGIANRRVPLDVRQYRALHVTSRFVPGATAPPASNTRFYAELTCSSVRPLAGRPGPFIVQLVMDARSDWRTFGQDLALFNEPTPEEPRIAGGAQACLAAVDAIRFTLATNLGVLESADGEFWIDDVYFE